MCGLKQLSCRQVDRMQTAGPQEMWRLTNHTLQSAAVPSDTIHLYIKETEQNASYDEAVDHMCCLYSLDQESDVFHIKSNGSCS